MSDTRAVIRRIQYTITVIVIVIVTIEIVEYLAADIQQKVDLGNPDWILCVNVIGQESSISLLKPEEVFSLGKPYP